MFLVTEPSPDTTLTDELKIDLTAFDREGIFGRFFLQVASVLVLLDDASTERLSVLTSTEEGVWFLTLVVKACELRLELY